MALVTDVRRSDPMALLAVLEIYRAKPETAYLNLARRIGDNIVANRFVGNLFIEVKGQECARFDAIDPLALLHLEAAIQGRPGAVPAFIGGAWRYLQGWDYGDGRRRTTDLRDFYRLPSS
jgi:pectate lyase